MCFEVANCFQALDLREGEGLRGELNTGGGGVEPVVVVVGCRDADCEAKSSACAGLPASRHSLRCRGRDGGAFLRRLSSHLETNI